MRMHSFPSMKWLNLSKSWIVFWHKRYQIRAFRVSGMSFEHDDVSDARRLFYINLYRKPLTMWCYAKRWLCFFIVLLAEWKACGRIESVPSPVSYGCIQDRVRCCEGAALFRDSSDPDIFLTGERCIRLRSVLT